METLARLRKSVTSFVSNAVGASPTSSAMSGSPDDHHVDDHDMDHDDHETTIKQSQSQVHVT